MTTFLTFSVYALRVSGDIPVQSDYLPLISVYFIMSSLYTLVSLIWFIVANLLITKKHVPPFFKKLVRGTENLGKRIRGSLAKMAKPKVKESGVVLVEDIPITNENLSKSEDFEKKIENNKVEKGLSEPRERTAEEYIKIMNRIFLLAVFFVMITSNLVLWLSMSFN